MRRPNRSLKRLLRAPALLYEHGLGWLLGNRFLCLGHVGRRSGRSYSTVLEVIGAGAAPGELVVVAGLGRDAEWYRNVVARPDDVSVRVAHRHFVASHRVLGQREAVALLCDYERRNRLLVPVIHWMLSWLVGWRYDGSDTARSRLAAELPFIALSPADGRGA